MRGEVGEWDIPLEFCLGLDDNTNGTNEQVREPSR